MGQHFGATPFLIAGPCVVEADDLNLRIGEALAELGARLSIHVIYKASYDKANRSRLKGARGPGLERGLEALAAVRSETGLPILTDVHEAGHVPAAAGADGFFLETHPNPDQAPSDGPNMVPLDQLAGLVSVALEVWQRAREAVRA